MAEENHEIVAAILAAGIVASGKEVIKGVAPEDAIMAVSLFHHCLKELQRTG